MSRNKPRYWVIETDSPGESYESLSAKGPFKSDAAAREWIRKDAAETAMGFDKSLRDADDMDFSAPKLIVEEKSAVSVHPTFQVRVRLEKAEWEPSEK